MITLYSDQSPLVPAKLPPGHHVGTHGSKGQGLIAVGLPVELVIVLKLMVKYLKWIEL